MNASYCCVTRALSNVLRLRETQFLFLCEVGTQSLIIYYKRLYLQMVSKRSPVTGLVWPRVFQKV